MNNRWFQIFATLSSVISGVIFMLRGPNETEPPPNKKVVQDFFEQKNEITSPQDEELKKPSVIKVILDKVDKASSIVKDKIDSIVKQIKG